MKNKVLFCITFLVVISCTTNSQQSFSLDSLGLEIIIKEKVFDWEDFHSPRGEGYTLEVYTFEKNENFEEKLLKSQSYPLSNDLRKNWQIRHWKANEVDNKYVLELLFNYKINDDEAKKEINNLERIVDNGDYVVAYYYKGFDDYIDSIDLFLLDFKNNKLYRCIVIT
ncbi:hypothetical protein [Flavobacterium sp.]|uniref:hypothetical protein n=1 Tax=Flavobacterium sp. TaxID=239 RepID=UPI0040348E4A